MLVLKDRKPKAFRGWDPSALVAKAGLLDALQLPPRHLQGFMVYRGASDIHFKARLRYLQNTFTHLQEHTPHFQTALSTMKLQVLLPYSTNI